MHSVVVEVDSRNFYTFHVPIYIKEVWGTCRCRNPAGLSSIYSLTRLLNHQF